MNPNVKTVVFWAVLICVAVLLWAVVKNGHTKPDRPLNFSEFLSEVQNGNIKSVNINGNTVKGDFSTGHDSFHTVVPSNYPKLYDMLSDKKVQMQFNENNSNSWVSILVNASPFLLLIGFWIFMMRQMQSGGNKALSFGKSRARLHSTAATQSNVQRRGGRRGSQRRVCRKSLNSCANRPNSRSWAAVFRKACC